MNFLVTKTFLIKRTITLTILASFLFTNALAITAFAGDKKQIVSADTAIARFTTDLDRKSVV